MSALDVSVQAQVLELLDDVRQRFDLAVLFITHDLRVAAQICDRIAVMQRGVVVEQGPTAEVFAAPKHEYTRALFEAAPGRNAQFGAARGRGLRIGCRARAAQPAGRQDDEWRSTPMNLTEYASYDALGLAELVAKKQVSPKELALTAVAAKEKIDPAVKSVVELYPDRIDGPRREEPGRRPVPRRAVPHQGRVRPREGPQDRVRLAPVRGHDGGGRHLFRRPAQGVGRQHPRPLGRARVLDGGHHRERHVRQHVEPLEAGLLGGRLQRRRTGGRDRRHRADRARLRHRRLDPHPRELVRRRRPQALAHARLGRARWWTRAAGATR